MTFMPRILNLGCGSDTYGTDFVDKYPSREKVIKLDMDNEKLPFKNNIFDEVYFKFVFEHLTNPLFVLKEIRRVLKSGGKLILITDNAGFFGPFGKTHYGGYEKLSPHDDDKHYALFTTHHLENWLFKAGFKNTNVRYWIGERTSSLHKILIKFFSLFTDRMYPNLEVEAYK